MSELKQRASAPSQIWHNNPALVQLLGLSPLLAVSTSLAKGLALGVATMMVLLCGNLTVSACRHLVRPHWRFVFFLLVLAVFTTLVDLAMQRYYFPLYRELGIYLPLISCNLALLLHLEMQAQHKSWQQSLVAAIPTGVGYLAAIVAFSALRELLLHGQIGSDWLLLLPDPELSAALPTAAPELFRFARLAPAALLLLGLLLALRNWLGGEPSVIDSGTTTPVTRARVTGKVQSS